MKKLSKLMAIAMATLIMISSFAACGKKDDTASTGESDTSATQAPAATEAAEAVTPTDVSLKVWAPENQIQTGTINSMCDSFQKLHPEWNITFTVETQGEDTAKDAILLDVAAAGDVFFIASDQLQELVNAGAVAKLGGSTAEMVTSTMAESVVDTATVDGSIYAIPFTHNTFFMYYDKSLLTEDDIKSVEGIMAKDTADGVYNFDFDSAGGWKLAAWYYGAGNTIYGPTATDYAAGCDWNNATGLAVTNYIIDLLNNPKCAYNDDVSLTELAGDHRIGAWFTGSWDYQTYKDILGDDLGVAVIPTFNVNGTDYQLKSFYGSKCIAVNAQAKNPEVAVAFAAYLGSEEMQKQRYIETAQVPSNMTVGASAEVQADEVAAVIVNEANIASVKQPCTAEFTSRYWANVAGFVPEIRSGDFNKDNAQEKLDTFVATMVVE